MSKIKKTEENIERLKKLVKQINEDLKDSEVQSEFGFQELQIKTFLPTEPRLP
jgi:hypothetical protein